MTVADPFAAPRVAGGGDSDGIGGASGEGATGRRRGVAFAGRHVDVPAVPAMPRWRPPTGPDATYTPDEDWEPGDLSAVNREINRCKARLFRVSRELGRAEDALAEAELVYDRHFRRALIAASGGSAEIRKAVAELQCEEFEDARAVARRSVEHWKRLVVAVREELDAVENQSHNVRTAVATFGG